MYKGRMDKLSKITDVLLAYARGVDPERVPYVRHCFHYQPAENGEVWTLTVEVNFVDTLGPLKGFKHSAVDREVCTDKVLHELNDFLTDEVTKALARQEGLESAMNLLLAESTLGEIWQEDPKEAARAEEAEDEKGAYQPSLIVLADR